MNKQKSFTLIELLVVIAIIGILSAVVVGSITKAKEKARIAKNLEFSHTFFSSLGVYANGIWTFDRLEAGEVLDVSGYGNNGTLYGDVSQAPDTPYSIIAADEGRYSLSFDGNGDYLRIADSPSLSIEGKEITLEAWIKPNAGAGIGDIISKYQHYSFRRNSAGSITYADSITPDYGTIGSYGTASAGRWSHVVVTFDGENIKFYIDGKLVGTEARPGSLTENDEALGIGVYNFSSSYFNGLIDDVRIYAKAVSSTEIEKLYAQGLKTHPLAEK